MNKKIVHREDYRIFNINTLNMTINGHDGEFYQIDAPDWVNVIAMTHNKIIVVKQYRIGIEAPTLEFPAGIIERGETPIEAARRELLEETGFTGQGEIIGTMHSNPAIMTNKCSTVLIKQAIQTGGQHLDTFEQIEVLTMSLHDIEDAITHGDFTHALHIASLYQLKAHLR